MEEQNICGWLISSLGAWKSGRDRECLKLDLTGREEEEEEEVVLVLVGRVEEKGITFLS